MTERIIDLSDRPARLSVRGGLLVISLREETPEGVIPAKAGIQAVDPRFRGGDTEGEAGAKTYRCERGPDPNEHTVPFTDIAVLIAAHPQITFSHAVLAGIAQAGGMFVVSNEKRMPCGMLLPLETHSTQSERFAAQAAASQPLRKRVWQEIVQAQIRARARLLTERTGGIAASGPWRPACARAIRRIWKRRRHGFTGPHCSAMDSIATAKRAG